MSKQNNSKKSKLDNIDIDGNIFIPLTQEQYINGIHILRFNEFEYIYNYLENDKDRFNRLYQFTEEISRLRANLPSYSSPYLTTNMDLNKELDLQNITFTNEDGAQFGRNYNGGVIQFIKDVYNKIDSILSNLEEYRFKIENPDNKSKLSGFSDYGEIRFDYNGEIRFILKDITLAELAPYYEIVKSNNKLASKTLLYKSLRKVLIKKDGSAYSLHYITQSSYNDHTKDINKSTELTSLLTYLYLKGRSNKTIPIKPTY